VLRKLWRARFGDKDAPAARRLAGVEDLRQGDLLTFKHRLSLPPALQGQTFEVSEVGTYHFDDGLHLQLTLDGVEGGRVYLSVPERGATELSLSREAPRADVLKLFDEAAFAALWDDGLATLAVATPLPEYEGWLGERYEQVVNFGEGYFYDRDRRGESVSRHVDDDAEELRYHECEDASGRFGVTVEVWADGETDVSLDVNCPLDVIDSMWPGESRDQ